MLSFLSDIGMVRSLNEDYVYYHEEREYKIYVVADGMGGHNAGEVASKMAAEGVVNFVISNFNELNAEDLLREAIERVNYDIFVHSREQNSLSGMGTTITACLVINDKVIVGNVGDSSCYAIKDDKIIKITKDHSLVQELVDLGTITEVEAANHPKKNIITRAVGTSEQLEVDIFAIDRYIYDMYLLCSDGLTNEVTKEEMVSIVNEKKDLISICDKLVNFAKYNGGRDNITVLLFEEER